MVEVTLFFCHRSIICYNTVDIVKVLIFSKGKIRKLPKLKIQRPVFGSGVWLPIPWIVA